ncbi:MAG: aspartate-semialdehyde dehydrogenase [Candidatus Sericytochromatia bacterium]|nr:aspartate-semialdehyde dehydrogenase [Candidatus Sericytochromatia bacterium]
MSYKVAVMGATGMVGQEMLQVLEAQAFPVGAVIPLASGTGETGRHVAFAGGSHAVLGAEDFDFAGVDLVLASAGEDVSARHAPRAAAAGAVVVDNTAFFRMHDEVPLVIPEINGEVALGHKGIIANPNCSTAIVLMAVAPLRALGGLVRMVVSTYQSASGAGKEAVAELQAQNAAILDGREPAHQIFHAPLGGNVLPRIGRLLPDGRTSEEAKMEEESRKIMAMPDLAVTCTCVRVPVLVGHSASVNLTFDRPVSPEAVTEVLRHAPGVRIAEAPDGPTPLDAAGQDSVLVGRIRSDRSQLHGVDLWVTGDNLRKGAALNAVQIAAFLHRAGRLGAPVTLS